MNVRQLKQLLEQYPDDMVILTSRYSDYVIVEEADWAVVKAVPNNFYYMRSHPTMSTENMEKENTYLHLAGN